jgi:hypothetical protein
MSAIWLLSGASAEDSGVLHSVDWVRFSREAHAPRSVEASAFRRIGSPQRPQISSVLLQFCTERYQATPRTEAGICMPKVVASMSIHHLRSLWR